MANKTERPQIFEIAFAAALDHWQDMIGVPQRFPRQPPEAPSFEQFQPMNTARPLQIEQRRGRIDFAYRAHASVTSKHLLAKVARIGAQLPFVDAEIGAEGESPGRDFEIAPSAERSAIGTLFDRGAIGKTAGHGAGGAQNISIIE